ncbi:MAG: plasmid mobilization relaxosome protein MobC [Aliarcobacter sp.]|jgi:hypothetical protein|nr:plasmid mobilization relaxosome protein MobC [Aliarcobacter sp.]
MSNLDKRLQIRCSQDEILLLEKKIKNKNISKSQFLRNAIFSTEVKEVDKSFQNKKLFLLNNIANNCNQIAKRANINKAVDRETLLKVDELLSYVKSLTKIEA